MHIFHYKQIQSNFFLTCLDTTAGNGPSFGTHTKNIENTKTMNKHSFFDKIKQIETVPPKLPLSSNVVI